MAEQERNGLILPPTSTDSKARSVQLSDSDLSAKPEVARLQIDSLSGQQRDELQELQSLIVSSHRELIGAIAYSAAKALQIGTYVLRAKEILGHGRYLRWIDQEVTPHCGLARRTLQRYARLARESDRVIERIGQLHFREGERALEFEEARQILHSMRLGDALSILQFGMSTKRGAEIAADVAGAQYEQDAARFFDMANVPFLAQVGWEFKAAQPLTGYQFLSPVTSRENQDAVTEAVAAHQAGDLSEAVLLLSGGGSARWLHLLDEFPRVLLRRRDSPLPASCDKQFLFGLIGAGRFGDFHQAFHALGAVLVPFRP